MNVKLLIKRYKFNKLLAKLRKVSVVKPNRLLILELVNFLDVNAFNQYHPIDGRSKLIRTRYKNAEVLNARLKTYILCIKNKEILNNGIDSDIEIYIDVDNFFTSNSNTYLNIHKEIIELRKNIKELCFLLTESDNVDYGYYDHTYRILTKTLITIRDLFIALNEIALIL